MGYISKSILPTNDWSSLIISHMQVASVWYGQNVTAYCDVKGGFLQAQTILF